MERKNLYSIILFILSRWRSFFLLKFWEGNSLTESGKDHLYIHGANTPYNNENNTSKDSFNNRVNWGGGGVQINVEK